MQDIILRIYPFILIIHFIGFIIGFGAALVSDHLFFSFAKDHLISRFESKILSRISKLVWVGVIIFTSSGIMLFLGKPTQLLNSQSFIAKMIIVTIVILNGLFLHFKVAPHLRELKFDQVDKKRDKSIRLNALVGGFVSISSWTTVLLLAITKGFGHSTQFIMFIYMIWILCGLTCCLYINKHFHKFFK